MSVDTGRLPSECIMVLRELDIISIVGLAAVFFIFVLGLCRRQRAKRRLQQPERQRQWAESSSADDVKTCRCPPSDVPRLSAAVSADHDAASGTQTSSLEVQTSASRPSTPLSQDVYRRQPSGSAICSGCQCSMTRCQCTIVLYRPSATSGDASAVTERPAGGTLRRLLTDNWVPMKTTATSGQSGLSPTGDSVTGDRRSRSGERAAVCRNNVLPNERYLTIPSGRSRSNSPSRTASGSRTDAVLTNGGGRIAEVNANEPSFKSKMA